MNWMRKLLGVAGLLSAALLGSQAASAATTVNLTAQRASLTLPDGQSASMWAYCGSAVAAGAGTTVGGACVPVPATAPAGTLPAWTQGPTIVVPAGDVLTITLSNTLPSPTSVAILGQIGGGLGLPTKVASPLHTGTGPATLTGGAVNPTAVTSEFAQAPATFTPPTQGPRMRAFVPEADGVSGSQNYVWTNLKPGTYLYESGSRLSHAT